MNAREVILSIPIETINNTNWFVFSDRFIQVSQVLQIVPISGQTNQFYVWCVNSNPTVFNLANAQILSI
jgi:hypothetical protein